MIRRLAIPAAIAFLSALPAAPASAQDAAQEGYNAGQRCPDFELFSAEGRPVKISEFRGRVVMIQFFASW